MKRRSFLAAAPALITSLPAAGLSQTPGSTAAAPLPRARWLDNGLIDAGGSHEPYIFVVRRGGQRRDAREAYERAQSEETILRLKQAGVEVFHTHLYKGMGMAAEKPEMLDAVRAAAVAHRHGLRVDSYIQWNTMMYETFFAEEPRAKTWIQRDISGLPILLEYGYQQSFRYRPCFSNQEYLDYFKRIVKFAVEEVKTDFIHFDNFDLNPEPDSCHCEWCVRGFRDYLKRKYSPEKSKERFGFENVDFVNPPQWNSSNPPARMQIIFDPAIQEWIDYRCQTMADALRQMASYAKSMNPEVAIEVNPHGITGGNRAWEAGLDHARILKSTQVFWTEVEGEPGCYADGRLVSRIRSYKLARAFRNILLAYITSAPLHMAECLAFNQTIGFAGQDPIGPDMRHYIAFYRRNRELFTGTEDVPTVAVLRSYPSIAYNNARTQLEAILVEQALIQSRIPFVLAFDEHLADLAGHKVLVLPDSECLSDGQVAHIRRFVENGGGLIVTGQAGLYDEWRRLRVKPGLSGLVDSQAPAKDYEETVEAAAPAGKPQRKEIGRGRVVYLPGMQFDGPLPEMGPYFQIGPRFWKLPRNWHELLDGIRWAAKDDLPVEIGGPPTLVANVVRQPDKRRVLLHLLNYNVAAEPSLKSIEITCRLPEGATAREVLVVSPDTESRERLETRPRGGAVTFTVPEVRVYSVIAVGY